MNKKEMNGYVFTVNPSLFAYDWRVYANRSITIGIGAVFVVAAALALWYYYEHQQSDASTDAGAIAGASAQYANSRFGYTFAYPSKYQVRELAPEFVMIGPMQNGSIEGVANVAVLHAQKSEPLPSSESFVRLVAQLACEQQNESASVKCTSVAQAGPFTTTSGMQGEELYFDSNTGKRGPFFAFDISRTVSGEYAVLLVYAPASLAQHDADRTLLQSIAQSMRIR